MLRDAFKRREKLDEGTLDRLQGLLREYLVVGGMPAVVDAYVETDDFQRAYEEQEKILRAYEADIEKYATDPDKPKIRQVYRSLPRQLAKEYTKFQFSKIEKRGTERKFGSSIDWLIDAGLVSSVSNVSLPILPLRAYEKPGEFKIYASDIGLCTHMFGFETQSALFQGLLKGPAKGGIYENLIFDMLSKRGKSVFYYKRENSEQEIEFFVEEGGEAVPVEVKSKRGATPSLNAYIEQYRPQLGLQAHRWQHWRRWLQGDIAAVHGHVRIRSHFRIYGMALLNARRSSRRAALARRRRSWGKRRRPASLGRPPEGSAAPDGSECRVCDRYCGDGSSPYPPKYADIRQ